MCFGYFQRLFIGRFDLRLGPGAGRHIYLMTRIRLQFSAEFLPAMAVGAHRNLSCNMWDDLCGIAAGADSCMPREGRKVCYKGVVVSVSQAVAVSAKREVGEGADRVRCQEENSRVDVHNRKTFDAQVCAAEKEPRASSKN
ncbi:unnamed protein product [Scytosiphon promiscuus]